jgi:hypothetical protein
MIIIILIIRTIINIIIVIVKILIIVMVIIITITPIIAKILIIIIDNKNYETFQNTFWSSGGAWLEQRFSNTLDTLVRRLPLRSSA